MRNGVYEKFAEALGEMSRPPDRHSLVQMKCAAMLAILASSRGSNIKTAQALPGQMSDRTLGDTMRKWLTPSHVLGAAAGLGGVHLLGKAVGVNPWKLALGAGALYGGYKLFSNPDIMKLVDIYGKEAIGYLGRQFRSMMPKQPFNPQKDLQAYNSMKFSPGPVRELAGHVPGMPPAYLQPQVGPTVRAAQSAATGYVQ